MQHAACSTQHTSLMQLLIHTVSFTNCSGHFINKLTLKLIITHDSWLIISYHIISSPACMFPFSSTSVVVRDLSDEKGFVGSLLACLLACSLTCLLACSLARLLACFLSCLLACLLARLLACLLACLLVCSLACVLVCLLACSLACLFARSLSWRWITCFPYALACLVLLMIVCLPSSSLAVIVCAHVPFIVASLRRKACPLISSWLMWHVVHLVFLNLCLCETLWQNEGSVSHSR